MPSIIKDFRSPDLEILPHALAIADDYLHQWEFRAELAEEQLEEWETWQHENSQPPGQLGQRIVEGELVLTTGPATFFRKGSNALEEENG